MSTVQSVFDLLQYRPDIQVNSDDLIHLVNAAIRAVSKRLYVLDSSLITSQLSVKVFAEAHTHELLTLDVAPGGSGWSAGDTITGVTSGETCEIVSVITTLTYYISDRTGAFTLGEVLTNGTDTADQGGANPTTTSLMVIVDSSPDTITYAGAQFVVEGFQADMPVTTSQTSNTGTYRLGTVAAGTLTFDSAESLTAAGSSSFIVTSDDSFGYLPSDFWGLRANFEPYLDGYTVPLIPLPGQEVALQYQTPGIPRHYKIQGTSRIYVTPHAGADYTIKGDYYQRPTAVTLDTSTIPWNELFDDLIAEYVEIGFRGAQSKSGNTVQILDKLIKDGVDLVVSRFDRKAPVYAPQAIRW